MCMCPACIKYCMSVCYSIHDIHEDREQSTVGERDENVWVVVGPGEVC